MAVRRTEPYPSTAWGAGAGTLGWNVPVSSYGGTRGAPAPPRRGKTSGRVTSRRPQFGQYPTQTPQQQQILSRLMRQTAQRPQYQPVDVPGEPRPTYGAVGLAGAGQRAGTLGRMMAVSPEEEAAAIQRMSAPAMRQFREEILPGIRGGAAATGTTWSTMRAGEEAKAGAGLAESLAGMGEQHRMQRRGQAMQAAGLSAQEALGGAGLGMQKFGMEMQPYMQAQQLGVQAGLQAQRLGAQQQMGQQGMLASLLGTPMMGVYTYPRQKQLGAGRYY